MLTASLPRVLEENIRNILSKNLGLVEAMMDQKDSTIFIVKNEDVSTTARWA